METTSLHQSHELPVVRVDSDELLARIVKAARGRAVYVQIDHAGDRWASMCRATLERRVADINYDLRLELDHEAGH